MTNAKFFALVAGACMITAAMLGCSSDKTTTGPGPGPTTGTEMIIVDVNDTVNDVVADRLSKITFTNDSNETEPKHILDSVHLYTLPRAGHMAYTIERPGSLFEIYTATTDGKNVSKIASISGIARFPGQPALSRDGKLVSYSLHDGHLILSNVDGSNVLTISNDADPEGVPDFSPDGKRIAFYGVNNQLLVIGVDGKNQRLLATGTQNDLEGRSKVEWSPDGTKLLYVGKNSNGQVDIYTANADGDPKTVQLTDDSYGDTDPTWSPDGTRIAWSSYPGDIYVMNANGSGRTNITFNFGFIDEFPCWSPRGNEILFSDHPREYPAALLKIYSFSRGESRTVAFMAFRGFWGKF